MQPPVTVFPPGSLAGRLLALRRGEPPHRRSVSAGESVFRQGDAATAIYLLESGRLRLTRNLADGSTVTLHIAEAGESFAEASLSAEHYHCDAVAETPATVLALPKRALLAALSMDAGESLSLTLAMAGQVRDLRAMLEIRNIRPAAQRLLAWLRLQASGTPPRVMQQRPWTLVASELGLTHEAVYRALASLTREGRISRDGNVVLLTPSRERP